ncbi:MAG: homocysteine S-methyltransferase [Phenylobacterium sp.]|uniref:homocysteine S-methyltransferase family protein n=1 Tax=Phenylobacterium sp. TaxID=1871053 RepID=UPI0025F7F141|nr:homocysteine S-methyltransferase family protein [Phenylobacterium sp.]MBA4012344.1 homocysteine S-methyltransferase [Phenylobacterium sp.]
MPPGADLPQLNGGLVLTDGGLETCLIFHDGVDLPHFAAFMLLRSEEGRATLRRYYEPYLQIAQKDRRGFILESPTWRASADWADRLGVSRSELAELNGAAIRLMRALKDEYSGRVAPLVVSGCVGPRGDGYVAGELMTAEAAEAYHADQISTFAAAGADMIAAITMTNVPEAIGIARAARAQDAPVAISFTVETDGKLPTGQALGEAVDAVDAATGAWPAYYMVNCAHPSHFAQAFEVGAPWLERVQGLRANASRLSHQELNDAADLDDGDPAELGAEHADILRRLPQIKVLGGCCGTDHRHVAAMSRACEPVG